MWSDEYVATYQAITGWATGHIALPGGVARQMQQMVRENTMITDRLVVGGEFDNQLAPPCTYGFGQRMASQRAAHPGAAACGVNDKPQFANVIGPPR